MLMKGWTDGKRRLWSRGIKEKKKKTLLDWGSISGERTKETHTCGYTFAHTQTHTHTRSLLRSEQINIAPGGQQRGGNSGGNDLS